MYPGWVAERFDSWPEYPGRSSHWNARDFGFWRFRFRGTSRNSDWDDALPQKMRWSLCWRFCVSITIQAANQLFESDAAIRTAFDDGINLRISSYVLRGTHCERRYVDVSQGPGARGFEPPGNGEQLAACGQPEPAQRYGAGAESGQRGRNYGRVERFYRADTDRDSKRPGGFDPAGDQRQSDAAGVAGICADRRELRVAFRFCTLER